MNVPTRPIRPDELLIPGQAVIVILEGEPSTTHRVATALQDTTALVLQRWASSETHPTRIGLLFRAILGIQAPTLVRWITDAAGPSPLRFSLTTTDIGELAETALDDVLETAIAVATFLPRAAGRMVGRYLKSGPGLLVAGFAIVGLVVVGVVLVKR